jgi:hypothetical protein
MYAICLVIESPRLDVTLTVNVWVLGFICQVGLLLRLSMEPIWSLICWSESSELSRFTSFTHCGLIKTVGFFIKSRAAFSLLYSCSGDSFIL